MSKIFGVVLGAAGIVLLIGGPFAIPMRLVGLILVVVGLKYLLHSSSAIVKNGVRSKAKENKDVAWRYVNPVSITYMGIFSLIAFMLLNIWVMSTRSNPNVTLSIVDTKEYLKAISLLVYPYQIPRLRDAGILIVQFMWLGGYVISAQPYKIGWRKYGSVGGVLILCLWCFGVVFSFLVGH